MRNEPTRVFDLLEVFSSRPGDQVIFSSVCNGKWRDYKVSEYREYANLTSYALLKSGISKGEPVISITQNRAEFNFVDMGILQVGAVHVPIYPAIDIPKLAAIIKETKAKIVFVSNKSVLKKIMQLSDIQLNLIVSFERTEGAIYYEDFLKQGTENQETLDVLKNAVKPEDPASIIYLSGSNTPLKGVTLSHNSHIFNILNYCKSHHFSGCRRSISFLPLAHSFERTVNYSFQFLGIEVCYSDGIASLPANLKLKKPDVMLAVPLVLERIIENTKAEIQKTTGINGRLARLALKLAAKEKAGPLSKPKSLKKALFSLVFKRLREFLGGNIKVMLCGGAALQPEILNILWAAGINTYEGYGLTEAGPLVSYNLISAFKSQSVGKLMLGVEVKIAPDHEVLVKSGGIMKGYYKQESSAIDDEGWLHTGDLGEIDNHGFLTLTGTKKEIFKLSSGLYTDPNSIEMQFAKFTSIKHIYIYGHNRPFLTALIVPKIGNKALNPKNTIENDNFNTKIEAAIDDYNKSCTKYDQIIKFLVVEDEWTQENGLQSAEGNLSRQALFSKYKKSIESFYL